MKKLEFIKGFTSSTNGWKRQWLIPALVSCLTSEETAQALNPMLLDDPKLRRAILNKVNADIDELECQSYHIKLVNELMSSFPSLPVNKKQICGYFLDFLYASLPSDLQRRVIRFFIVSRYITLRNRGYKILRLEWGSEYEQLIMQSWKKHHDYYCALLILKHFSDKFIIQNFNSMEKTLRGKEGYPKLYIRIGDKKPSLLQRLERQDSITYTYVMFKLGRSITEQQAANIFNQFKFDNRIGLFFWCLGKMKLWSILENIAGKSEQLNEEQLAWYRKKYGIKETNQNSS